MRDVVVGGALLALGLLAIVLAVIVVAANPFQVSEEATSAAGAVGIIAGSITAGAGLGRLLDD